MQVDPIKPSLKAPGSKRFETKIGSIAFKFCIQCQLAPLQPGWHQPAAAATAGISAAATAGITTAATTRR